MPNANKNFEAFSSVSSLIKVVPSSLSHVPFSFVLCHKVRTTKLSSPAPCVETNFDIAAIWDSIDSRFVLICVSPSSCDKKML
jgi:hypothetical protein